jgi:hypothetical protein
MKTYKSIFFYYLILQFILIATFAKSETLESIARELSAIQEEIKALPISNIKESIAIDESIKAIDNTVSLAIKSVSEGDIKMALSSSTFITKIINDVSSNAPSEFITEKMNADLSNLTDNEIKEYKAVTSGLSIKKQNETNNIINDMAYIDKNSKKYVLKYSLKPINSFAVTRNLKNLNIPTITPLNIYKSLAHANSVGRIITITPDTAEEIAKKAEVDKETREWGKAVFGNLSVYDLGLEVDQTKQAAIDAIDTSTDEGMREWGKAVFSGMSIDGSAGVDTTKQAAIDAIDTSTAEGMREWGKAVFSGMSIDGVKDISAEVSSEVSSESIGEIANEVSKSVETEVKSEAKNIEDIDTSTDEGMREWGKAVFGNMSID